MTDCDAGRTAFFGGAWTSQCSADAIHHIASPSTEPIRLCEEHFKQVLAAGLVKEPNLGAKEFMRREKERTGSGGLKGLLRRGPRR